MTNRSSFDISRAVLQDYGSALSPARLEVQAMRALSDALAAGQIAPDAHLLGFERGGALYAVPMPVVLAYNVIQGKFPDGQPWLLTFCNACNTGMVFCPAVDGVVRHFQRRGAYDGLMLIWDQETGSYWQHISGESLYGPSVGKRLTPLSTTRMMTARAAAARDLPVWLPAHDLPAEQRRFSAAMESFRAEPAAYETAIAATIGAGEDSRLPRFELGLGLWDDARALFVPLSLLHARNNALVAHLSGRAVVVYQDEEALSPIALYAETTTARWESGAVRLDNGAAIRRDLLVPANGDVRLVQRPSQLLVRWLGFSATFPGCTILTDSG